jgi:pimeloyl-ACP methyl ester carboxylesterase
VLTETVPEGRIILVGHSMGGMTIMAFAEQFPAWFGNRVTGVVLISTSAGLFDKAKLGITNMVPSSVAAPSTGPGWSPPTWPGC